MEDTWHSLEKMRESSRKVGALGYCLGGKLCDLNAAAESIARRADRQQPEADRAPAPTTDFFERR